MDDTSNPARLRACRQYLSGCVRGNVIFNSYSSINFLQATLGLSEWRGGGVSDIADSESSEELQELVSKEIDQFIFDHRLRTKLRP